MLSKDSLELLLGLCHPSHLRIDWSKPDAEKAIAIARETRTELERQFAAFEKETATAGTADETPATDDGA